MGNYLISDIAYSGRFEGKTHLLPVRIYYEGTDMSGVVYHANYIRYFERGRTDFLRCAGVIHTELAAREKPLAFAVIAMDVRYKKAARIDDSLLVHTEYGQIKGARMHIKQWITRGDDLVATNDVTAVQIDMQGNPVRPQKDFVEALAPFLSDNAQ